MRSRLFDLPQWQRAKSIFCYVSVGNEPDTHEIIQEALLLGKTVSVPRTYKKGKMLAHVIFDMDCLLPGAHGIPEPPITAAVLEVPDIAILPCLACDRQGNRLGHGGGYYDRYLSTVNCYSICLCPDELLFQEIPHGKSDFKPDMILTQTQILRREDKIQ